MSLTPPSPEADPPQNGGPSGGPLDVSGSGSASEAALAEEPALRLSESLASLIAHSEKRDLLLQDLIAVMRGRAYDLLLIVLALPFCTPIPLPGLAIPFGMAIAVIGFRLSLGLTPWLPQRILLTRIPAGLLRMVLSAARRIVLFLETVLRPRWLFMWNYPFVRHGIGVMVMIAGLLLIPPLPIPGTNFFPAATVIALAGAMLERDGHFILFGTALFCVSLTYFALVFYAGGAAVGWLAAAFA